MIYHLFARHEYAEPLELIETFEADRQPTLDDLPQRDDTWLEVCVLADDDATWILRDGELVAAIDVEVSA